jgi:hypothetical protein
VLVPVEFIITATHCIDWSGTGGMAMGEVYTAEIETASGEKFRLGVALNAAGVLPDHSASGDGSLVAAELNLIFEIRTRALALKRQGRSPDDAGKQVSSDLKTRHPDWPNTNAAGFVKSVYAELQ